jgi:large subunit ribosomal protein L23
LRDARDIIIKPIISEKSYDLAAQHKFTFKVDRRATKPDVRRAIEQIFKVNVISVNTSNMKGKPKRQGMFSGHRPDWKKAVVTLAEGQTIEVFEGGAS